MSQNPFQNPLEGIPVEGEIDKLSGSYEDSKGRFANSVLIRHNINEFIIDFSFVIPPDNALISRIVITPSLAFRFSKILESNLKKYKDEHGKKK